MADLKVRNLDDHVADVLRARAQQKRISLEEEVRRTLRSSVDADREAFIRRAAAIRAASEPPSEDPEMDSVRLIREQRDAWG